MALGTARQDSWASWLIYLGQQNLHLILTLPGTSFSPGRLSLTPRVEEAPTPLRPWFSTFYFLLSVAASLCNDLIKACPSIQTERPQERNDVCLAHLASLT
jgi:hypothetical protein